MGRYVLRRLWQLIPTLFGVLAITFLLFHVVGGSPAALMLGKHQSPQGLEEFDEARGFNKPLFFGRWTRTRAYPSDRRTPFPADWRRQPGAAIVAVRMENVKHEFSTIPGCFEDVTEIVLNLKEVVLDLGDKEVANLRLDAKGPCEVTAGMITGDVNCHVVNADLHIASLNEEG